MGSGPLLGVLNIICLCTECFAPPAKMTFSFCFQINENSVFGGGGGMIHYELKSFNVIDGGMLDLLDWLVRSL